GPDPPPRGRRAPRAARRRCPLPCPGRWRPAPLPTGAARPRPRPRRRRPRAARSRPRRGPGPRAGRAAHRPGARAPWGGPSACRRPRPAAAPRGLSVDLRLGVDVGHLGERELHVTERGERALARAGELGDGVLAVGELRPRRVDPAGAVGHDVLLVLGGHHQYPAAAPGPARATVEGMPRSVFRPAVTGAPAGPAVPPARDRIGR